MIYLLHDGPRLYLGLERKLLCVRYRQSLEGICGPHHTIGNTIGFERAAHEDRRAAAPDSGFDKIPGNAVTQNTLNAVLDVIESSQRNHRNSIRIDIVRRAIHREPEFVVVNVGFSLENSIGERPFQKVKIQICRSVHVYQSSLVRPIADERDLVLMLVHVETNWHSIIITMLSIKDLKTPYRRHRVR